MFLFAATEVELCMLHQTERGKVFYRNIIEFSRLSALLVRTFKLFERECENVLFYLATNWGVRTGTEKVGECKCHEQLIE